MIVGGYWFFAALTAAMLWGLGYVLCEVLLKNGGISPVFIATMTSIVTLPVFLGLAIYYDELKPGFQALAENQKLIPILLLEAFTIVGGTFLIYTSVAHKNATLTAAIESTYPVFSVIFAYFILKQLQLNIWSATGVALILVGVTIIYFKQ